MSSDNLISTTQGKYNPSNDPRATKDFKWLVIIVIIAWVQVGVNFNFWGGMLTASLLFSIGMVVFKLNQKGLSQRPNEPDTKIARLKRLAIPILVYFMVAILTTANGDAGDKSASSKKTGATDTTKLTKEDKPAQPVTFWDYAEKEDRMSGQQSYWATCSSVEKLKFDFPYDGGASLFLVIRKQGGQNEIILQIEKGQFMSNLMGDQVLKFRFDEGKPISVGYSEAADGSSDYIFVQNSASLLSKIRKSKKLLVEAPFFNEGRRVVEFWIDNLDWPH
jgi:hypothetical protein